jgi:BMFP domain-containing protein YqiC
MAQEERIAELEALVARQQQQNEQLLAVNAELRARVQELEARLAKDSHNSSTP